jgi:hypothetical protein
MRSRIFEQQNLQHDPRHQDRLSELRKELKTRIQAHHSPYSDGTSFIPTPPISGPRDVPKWPGFHSTKVDTDVLHYAGCSLSLTMNGNAQFERDRDSLVDAVKGRYTGKTRR